MALGQCSVEQESSKGRGQCQGPQGPASYLREQLRDDLQRGLADGVVLQRGRQGHVHQGSDLLQDDFPTAGVAQNFLIFVNLFLVERKKETQMCIIIALAEGRR